MARHLNIDVLRHNPDLSGRVARIFGDDSDEVEHVVHRSQALFGELPVAVWEADPLTFRFTYVSTGVEALLGYPRSDWLQPDFWRSRVVHPEDVSDAVAHCAIATARGMDHDFEYRALKASGEVLLVHDAVRVVKGPLGFTSKLRGVMFPAVRELATS